MTMHIVRYIHVLLSVTLYGAVIANYYYVAIAYKSKDTQLIQFSLKNSLIIDWLLLLPLYVVAFITGTWLHSLLNIPITTPWLFTAYLLLTSNFIFFFILNLIKTIHYKNTVNIKFITFFHLLNIVSILFFALIIHDAVTRSTLFM